MEMEMCMNDVNVLLDKEQDFCGTVCSYGQIDGLTVHQDQRVSNNNHLTVAASMHRYRSVDISATEVYKTRSTVRWANTILYNKILNLGFIDLILFWNSVNVFAFYKNISRFGSRFWCVMFHLRVNSMRLFNQLFKLILPVINVANTCFTVASVYEFSKKMFRLTFKTVKCLH